MDNIIITELARIFRNSRGVIKVLKRVSPSIIPVIIAITRVNGKTTVENIRTSFNIPAWKVLKSFRNMVRNGIRITNAWDKCIAIGWRSKFNNISLLRDTLSLYGSKTFLGIPQAGHTSPNLSDSITNPHGRQRTSSFIIKMELIKTQIYKLSEKKW